MTLKHRFPDVHKSHSPRKFSLARWISSKDFPFDLKYTAPRLRMPYNIVYYLFIHLRTVKFLLNWRSKIWFIDELHYRRSAVKVSYRVSVVLVKSHCSDNYYHTMESKIKYNTFGNLHFMLGHSALPRLWLTSQKINNIWLRIL